MLHSCVKGIVFYGRQRIEKQLELGLSAQRVYQELKVECGFMGSYASGQRQTESASIGSLQTGRKTTKIVGSGLAGKIIGASRWTF